MSRHEQTIVVIGGGGHAKVLISILRKLPWHVAGYTDSQDRGALLGAPYLGDDKVLPGILAAHPDCAAALAVGKVDTSPRRSGLQQQIESLGFRLPVIVSPSAVVNLGVELGPGTVVFDGAVVNADTVTGTACIINTNATLEHDCRLGADVHIAPGATVSGGVAIGSHSCIGAGAVVIQGLSIADNCLIGAGSVVTGDIETPGTYAGVPARSVRA
jgi:sugar O-acyltransferase (sialic acid O-acetyltransferase NeuD family)